MEGRHLMTTTDLTLGTLLRAIRTDHGLSGTALAQLAGVHRSTLSAVENGRYKPSSTWKHKIASALAASMARAS